MKLHRLALPDPFLMFLIALIGGTLWLLHPVPDAMALVRPPVPQVAAVPLPIAAPPAESPALRGRPDLAAIRTELEEARKAIRERAAALDMQNAQIEMLQRKVDALRAEQAALEAQRASREPAAAVSSTEEAHLEDVVKERRVEISRLESELANLKSALAEPSPDEGQIPRAIRVSQKLPVLVDLSGNRIAPVTSEFFRLPMFARSSEITATRKKPGESIAEARAPNSQFRRFLSKIHADSHYISCLLNSDSFEAFYAVRDMVTRAGYDIAWEPADTSNGQIAIQRVKLVRAPREVVTLPDIMRSGGAGH